MGSNSGWAQGTAHGHNHYAPLDYAHATCLLLLPHVLFVICCPPNLASLLTVVCPDASRAQRMKPTMGGLFLVSSSCVVTLFLHRFCD
jgi:UDP-N-acetylmuramyl pentapeptide phosphotransferase/UDP-N-acetylglucosamine-1-phosphate transferase